MTAWRPPSTPQERITRAIRSMSSGTLDGRIVSAYPINHPSTLEDDDDSSEATDSEANVLPFTDYYPLTSSSILTFTLTFSPYVSTSANGKATFHVYWNNVFQEEDSYTLVGQTLTLSDPNSLIRDGDTITVKYWYDSDSPYIGPSLTSGNLCTDPHPDDFHNWVGGPLGGGGGAFNGFMTQSSLHSSDGLYIAIHGGAIGTYLSLSPNGNSSQIVDTSSPLALNLGTFTRAYDVVVGGVLTYEFKVYAPETDVTYGWTNCMYEVFDISGTRLSVTSYNHPRSTDITVHVGETKTLSGSIDFTDILTRYPTATCVTFIEEGYYSANTITYVGSADVRITVE